MWEEFLADIAKPSLWFPIICTAVLLITGLIIEYRTGLFSHRRKKELTYRILSEIRIHLSADEAFRHRLKILFDGQPVESGVSLQIKLTNTGNVPIDAEEFKKPIRFEFGDARLLYFTVQETEPEDLNVKLTAKKHELDDTVVNAVQINPLLLNRGDSVTLALIADGYQTGNIKITGRVKGTQLQALTLADIKRRQFRKKLVFAALSILFIVISMFLFAMNLWLGFFALTVAMFFVSISFDKSVPEYVLITVL